MGCDFCAGPKLGRKNVMTAKHLEELVGCHLPCPVTTLSMCTTLCQFAVPKKPCISFLNTDIVCLLLCSCVLYLNNKFMFRNDIKYLGHPRNLQPTKSWCTHWCPAQPKPGLEHRPWRYRALLAIQQQNKQYFSCSITNTIVFVPCINILIASAVLKQREVHQPM